VELEPRQRNALIIGAVIGAIVGAGAGWLLTQPTAGDLDEPREPVRLGDVLKITGSTAALLRQFDDLRQRR